MSLGKVSRFWRFNETLFAPLAWVAGSHELAVRIAAVATLAVALVAAFRRFEPERTALCVIAASLLLSPNVLPWYALWLLPILVVLDVPAAVVFTATVALAYAVYPRWLAGATWHVGWGLRALEYGPCLVVLIGSALRAGRARSAARL
jgi:hypothetical protein